MQIESLYHCYHSCLILEAVNTNISLLSFYKLQLLSDEWLQLMLNSQKRLILELRLWLRLRLCLNSAHSLHQVLSQTSSIPVTLISPAN